MAAAAYFVGATVLTCSLAYNIAITVGFFKDYTCRSNQRKISLFLSQLLML